MFPKAEVISLDIDPTCGATHTCDIMDFDYLAYPSGHFDIIWASPDCRIFSQAMHSWIGRKFDSTESLNHERQRHWKYPQQVLKIVNHLRPRGYFIENPYYSAMNKIPELKQHFSVRKDYCMYGRPFRKSTRIWTNIDIGNTLCEHATHAVTLSFKGTWNDKSKRKADLHAIPEKLLQELFKAVTGPGSHIES